MSIDRKSIGLQAIVLSAVGLWCGIHTYGLWRHDSRRSLILVLCSVFILGLWGSALALRWRFNRRAPVYSTPDQWNVACLLGLILSALGVLFAVPVYFPKTAFATTTASWAVIDSGWIAGVFLSIATLSSIVGLSHPVIRKGKRFGLIALGIAGIVMLGLFVRILSCR